MEIFDLYDAQRRLTGETMVRGTPVPPGRFRQVVHVCIFNGDGELLIQQRQSTKDSWADLWDVTVGGSVISGETSAQGAKRELMEELGLEAAFEDLAPAVTTTFTGGFDDFYILHMELDPADLTLQESEVQAVTWATEAEVLELLDNGQFIPYQRAFLQYIFFRKDHGGNFDIQQ